MTTPKPLGSAGQAELYLRGRATLLASWEAYARGAAGAAVHRLAAAAAAVFPHEPERAVYNNALPGRDLGPDERAAAADAIEAGYAAAGVTRFAAWVHETDEPMRAELERRGYTLDTTTRAMGMVEQARRRGLGTALTAAQVHAARARGCRPRACSRPRWPSASTPPWASATSAASSNTSPGRRNAGRAGGTEGG